MDFYFFGIPKTSSHNYAASATGWTAPNIHPHIRIWCDAPEWWTPPGYTGSTAATPAGWAAVFNGWISYYQNDPVLRDKKVNLFLQNFGTGNLPIAGAGTTATPQLFNHPNDLALIPVGATQHLYTPYCDNGISECRSWIDDFVSGIGDNVYLIDAIHEDMEFQSGSMLEYWLAFGANGTTSDWGWFQDALTDPRSTANLVDGYQTYSDFVSNNFTSAEQTLIRTTSFRFADSLEPHLNKMNNLSQRVVRYALWKGYFEAFYDLDPTIKMSNYNISNYTEQIPFLSAQKPWIQTVNPDWTAMKSLPWYKGLFPAPIAYGSAYDAPGGSTAAFNSGGFNIFGNDAGGYTATSMKHNMDIVGYAMLANKRYHAQRIPGAVGAETVVPWVTWDWNGLTFGHFRQLIAYYDSIGVQAVNVWYDYVTSTGAPNGSLTGVLSQLADVASSYTT